MKITGLAVQNTIYQSRMQINKKHNPAFGMNGETAAAKVTEGAEKLVSQTAKIVDEVKKITPPSYASDFEATRKGSEDRNCYGGVCALGMKSIC